jgi:hypothetical protein
MQEDWQPKKTVYGIDVPQLRETVESLKEDEAPLMFHCMIDAFTGSDTVEIKNSRQLP